MREVTLTLALFAVKFPISYANPARTAPALRFKLMLRFHQVMLALALLGTFAALGGMHGLRGLLDAPPPPDGRQKIPSPRLTMLIRLKQPAANALH